MQVRSQGLKTDLMFIRFDGEIVDRGSYLVARSPLNPEYYWGNFLVFPRPPQPGDSRVWPEIFRKEFAHEPRVRHVAITWDSPEGDAGAAAEFLSKDYEIEPSVVLTTGEVCPPPKIDREAEIRPLRSESDWEQAIRNQVACRAHGFSFDEYLLFKQNQFLRYRRMQEAGLGFWFGAFLDGRLVGDLGVYCQGGVGRFQAVGTHPDFRRRGICGTMVHQAARMALDQLGAKTLVMAADEHYHAARIYESVGFRPTERQVTACLRPKSEK